MGVNENGEGAQSFHAGVENVAVEGFGGDDMAFGICEPNLVLQAKAGLLRTQASGPSFWLTVDANDS